MPPPAPGGLAVGPAFGLPSGASVLAGAGRGGSGGPEVRGRHMSGVARTPPIGRPGGGEESELTGAASRRPAMGGKHGAGQEERRHGRGVPRARRGRARCGLCDLPRPGPQDQTRLGPQAGREADREGPAVPRPGRGRGQGRPGPQPPRAPAHREGHQKGLLPRRQRALPRHGVRGRHQPREAPPGDLRACGRDLRADRRGALGDARRRVCPRRHEAQQHHHLRRGAGEGHRPGAELRHRHRQAPDPGDPRLHRPRAGPPQAHHPTDGYLQLRRDHVLGAHMCPRPCPRATRSSARSTTT